MIGTTREITQSHSTREICLQVPRRSPIKVPQQTTKRSLRYVLEFALNSMLTEKEDEVVPEPESEKEEDEKANDFSKDKMIKPVKPKGKAKEVAKKKK